MNLYEIDARIMEAFEAAVDEETGEIVNEEAYAALDALQEARDEKIENVLLWIKDLKSDAEQLKNEKRVLETRREKPRERRIRCRSMLKEHWTVRSLRQAEWRCRTVPAKRLNTPEISMHFRKRSSGARIQS